MEQKPILSICLPTYNGGKTLQQCLDNIVRQFSDEQVKNAVEVVVSDNASTDNTAEIVKKFQASFSNIRYIKNETNIGFDENMIQSAVKASGKYCWHIGDDDFMQNGILALLVDFLSKNNISLLTVEYHHFVDIAASQKLDPAINQKNHIELHNGSPEAFLTKGYCEASLGVFIFDQATWLKADRKNYQKMWSNYEIVLKMMKLPGATFARLHYPALYVGQDFRWKKNGGGLFTYIDWIRLIRKLAGFGYGQEYINHVTKITTGNFPVILLDAKNNDLACSFANLKLIYTELYEYPGQVFFATIIFFIPNVFIKKLKALRNILRSYRPAPQS